MRRRCPHEGLWKRTVTQAEQADTTVDVLILFKFGVKGIADFDVFSNYWRDMNIMYWHEPQELDKPYKIVDVTARGMTILDSIDNAVGLVKEDNYHPTELTLKDIQIKAPKD